MFMTKSFLFFISDRKFSDMIVLAVRSCCFVRAGDKDLCIINTEKRRSLHTLQTNLKKKKWKGYF